MASSLAQLGVQYMPATGGCILDLAALPAGLFDSCNAIHIRIPEAQHRVDVHSNMICIKPTQPVAGAGHREQYMYPDAPAPTKSPHVAPQEHKQRPPSFDGPDGPVLGSLPVSPTHTNVLSIHREGPTPTIRTRIRTTTRSGTTTITHTPPRVSHPTRLSTEITTTTATHGFNPSTSRNIHVTSPTTLTTRLSPSESPSSSSSHTPRPAVISPPPLPSAPSSSPEPSLLPSPSPDPEPEQSEPEPEPEPLPDYCASRYPYITLDVSTIDSLDPHDLDLYLDLLGLGDVGLDIDPDLDHGVTGLVSGLLDGAVDDDGTRGIRRELERSYRVLCGVDVESGLDSVLDSDSESESNPESDSDSDSDSSSESSAETEPQTSAPFRTTSTRSSYHRHTVSAVSQRACLEACEKRAVARARDGWAAACLGAAWHRARGAANCRVWVGGRDQVFPEPAERLGTGGRGEWDLVYL